MANTNLKKEKAAKNDEFYTQYADIQNEINAYIDYNPDAFRGKTILLPCDDPEWSNFTKFFVNNFERYGIKKLISTSYAYNSKKVDFDYQPTLFETVDPRFKIETSKAKGKIFTLTQDENKDGKIDEKDLKWSYLDGDGDFRSNEIIKLRDEADIIITNPPFSLFREFVAWIFEGGKQFSVIGNMNAITYKEIFPLIKENKIWLDNPFVRGAGYFTSPLALDKTLSYYNSHDYREGFIRVPDVRWFTNLEHGKRHMPLKLMTEAQNIKFSKHKEIKDIGYKKYDNYDAMEVPFTDSIPADYKGTMGVPISFLDKYCPEQFEILGMCENEDLYKLKTKVYNSQECKQAYYNKFGKEGTYDLNASGVITVNGLQEKVYQRILIKHR